MGTALGVGVAGSSLVQLGVDVGDGSGDGVTTMIVALGAGVIVPTEGDMRITVGAADVPGSGVPTIKPDVAGVGGGGEKGWKLGLGAMWLFGSLMKPPAIPTPISSRASSAMASTGSTRRPTAATG